MKDICVSNGVIPQTYSSRIDDTQTHTHDTAHHTMRTYDSVHKMNDLLCILVKYTYIYKYM